MTSPPKDEDWRAVAVILLIAAFLIALPLFVAIHFIVKFW